MDFRSPARTMIRSAIFLAGCLALASCSNHSDRLSVPSAPPPSKGELADYRRAYVACLFDAANRADDQASDPQTVAQAITPTCATEFDAMVGEYVAGYDADAASLAAKKWERARLSLAVSVVERERELKKPPPKAHHGHKSS
jgi:hypothetical protein